MQNIKLKGKLFAILLAFVMIFTGLGIGSWGIENAYADTTSETNVPTSLDETMVKWSTAALNSGWTNCLTAPVQLGDYLYIVGFANLKKIAASNGKIVASSTEKVANGYNYTLTTNGTDLIFVQTGTKVMCFDTNLTLQWTSASVTGNQGNAELVYNGGILYGATAKTGTTTISAVGDGKFFAIDTNATTDGGIIPIKWSTSTQTFNVDGSDKYDGSYWAKASVIGNYVLYGSEGSEVYVLDASNGTVKDKFNTHDITGTPKYNKGIRSGIVSENVAGSTTETSIYFTRNDGYIFKGTFDRERGDVTTASAVKIVPTATNSISTPKLYGNRIYVGCTKSDDTKAAVAVLSKDDLSLKYQIPLGPSGNTADNKGMDVKLRVLDESTKKVAGFVTYYAKPGSIFCFIDDQNTSTYSKEKTFDMGEITSSINPQYQTSQAFIGEDGTIYIGNDSGILVALQKNTAYLSSLSAVVSGSAIDFKQEFKPYIMDYELVVPEGTTKVAISYTPNGGSQTIDSVELDASGKATKEITVTKDEDTRKYNILIRKKSNVASIARVDVNGSNSISNDSSNLPSKSNIQISEPNIYEITGFHENGTTAEKNNRVHLSFTDSKSTVTWTQLSGGIEKTLTSENAVYAGCKFTQRIGYTSGIKGLTTGRLTVTAEDGVTSKDYYLIITSGDTSSYKLATEISVDSPNVALSKANKEKQLSVNVIKSVGTATNYSDSVKWTSSNPSVATVDSTGKVTAVTTGKAKITAEYGITKATCDVTVTGMPATVYVTIGDKGEVATAEDGTSVAQKKVSVNDEDNDGALTVNDALIATHNNLYQGGSSAGYAAKNTECGLSITKLWGDTSGNYGYWINNNSCWSLTDPINAGDYLTAFVYKDSGYSDTYTKFENQTYNATAGQNVMLQVGGYSWKTYSFTPYQGATVKVLGANNGSYNTFTTDTSGQVTLKFPSAGTYYVEAYEANASKYMVPCVCKVVVAPASSTPTEGIGTVTFTMKGDTVHTGTLHQGTSYPTWIASTTVTLSDSIKTVGNVFKKVLDEKGFKYVGLSGNYVSSITNANGVTLAEFTNGNNSGWKYRVNGDEPQKGLNEYVLSDGDSIEFFYTDDYTKDPGADKWLPVEEEKTVSTNAPATIKDNTASATITASDVNKLITDAGTKKATEITLNVTNTGTAKDVVIELPKASLTDVVSKTDANLVVATPQGNVTLDQKTMGEIALQAKGSSIIIEIKKVENTDDTLKDKIGENASVIDVTVKSGDTIIKSFNGNKITLTIELSNDLKDKTLTGIRINENGKLEKLGGKKITKDGKMYFALETAQLSEYAVAEESVVDATIAAQEKAEKIKAGVKATTIKTLKAKATKGKVVLTFTKSKGYKVDGYYIYKSTKKTTGFKYLGKTAKNKFTNKKSLTKGKAYYYKVKGYRLVDGVKVFTKTKTIKVVAK